MVNSKLTLAIDFGYKNIGLALVRNEESLNPSIRRHGAL